MQVEKVKDASYKFKERKQWCVTCRIDWKTGGLGDR